MHLQGGTSPQKPITDLLGRLGRAGSVLERLRRMPPQDLPQAIAHVTVRAFGREGTEPSSPFTSSIYAVNLDASTQVCESP